MKKQEKSIITFSRRTDPAFYMDWFIDKINKGGCYVTNPYSGKPYYVSLSQNDVLLMNFWTKNPQATLLGTRFLMQRGYSVAYFISQTNYPRWLERGVPLIEHTLDAVLQLKEMIPRASIWWRYDPIIITRKLNRNWHIDNFSRLCEELWKDNTERVIISLAHIDGAYKAIRQNLISHCLIQGDELIMPGYDEFINLAQALSGIANKHGIILEVCCSPSISDSDKSRVNQAACLSIEYLRKIIPELPSLKISGTRRGSDKFGYAPCGCVKSRDIGSNGTCLHGCVYCYANRGQNVIKRGWIHPESPWLSPKKIFF